MRISDWSSDVCSSDLYRTTGRFGRGAGEFPDTVVTYLAEQIGASPAELEGYDWLGRSGRRHRAEILDHLGFRRARRQDMQAAAAWTGLELDRKSTRLNSSH